MHLLICLICKLLHAWIKTNASVIPSIYGEHLAKNDTLLAKFPTPMNRASQPTLPQSASGRFFLYQYALGCVYTSQVISWHYHSKEGDIMEKSQHRHDISDKAWAILEPMLPGQRGQWGGIAEDNRRFINGVFWILRTGAPWRDLPPDYGKWGSVHQRFRRWRDKGIWEKILEALIDDPDYEWLMIDASHCKVHPHAAGAKGGNQDMGRTKGGSTPRFTLPWIRLVCRSERLSQRAPELIAGRLYTLSRE